MLMPLDEFLRCVARRDWRGLAPLLGFHIPGFTIALHRHRHFAAIDVAGSGLLLGVLVSASAAASLVCLAAKPRSRILRALAISLATSAALLLVVVLLQRTSPCAGCPTLLLPSCPERVVDHTYFHRLQDCLVPRYMRLQNATRCIVTTQGEVGDFVDLLLGARGFRAIDPAAACTNWRWPRLLMSTVDPTAGLRLMHDDVRAFVRERASTHASTRTATAALTDGHAAAAAVDQAARSDADAEGAPPRRYIVLLQRQPPQNRAFGNTTLARMRKSLQHLGVGPVRVAYGDEGAAATVALFANALGVVGFHGAGLANALFIWRSNRRVADETGAPLRWQVMNISSSAIAEHNGKEASRMMSKMVPFIPLRAHEIAQASALLRHCVRALPRGEPPQPRLGRVAGANGGRAVKANHVTVGTMPAGAMTRGEAGAKAGGATMKAAMDGHTAARRQHRTQAASVTANDGPQPSAGPPDWALAGRASAQRPPAAIQRRPPAAI